LIVNDLLLELILIIIQIALLGSAGIIGPGVLLLTIISTIYNMAVAVDVWRKISKRSNAYKMKIEASAMT
jgi:hypothetical protein